MGSLCDDVITEISTDIVSDSVYRGDMSLLCAISKTIPAQSAGKAQDIINEFVEKGLCKGSSVEDMEDLFSVLWRHYGYDLCRNSNLILEVSI